MSKVAPSTRHAVDHGAGAMGRFRIICPSRMNSQPPQDISASERSTHPIGIIIPTYNRSNVLLSCLKHLERQTWSDFEVIVVDDGSTDSTPRVFEEYQRQSPLTLRYIRQENSGPARARNVAIAALQSPICLMIGDDIFASPALVSKHLQLHQQKPALQIAALGLTQWSNSGQTVTKFMRWLDESGIQFSYNDLLGGVLPNWKHFYTSNLSLKTKLLRENPFDESFTKAAVEDLELGYRLEQQRGLEVVFMPDAFAHHLHPTSFRQACRRMFNVGLSTRHFYDIWPGSLPVKCSLHPRTIRDFMQKHQWSLSPIITLVGILTSVWCPNPLMRKMLHVYFVLGYRSAGLLGQEIDASGLKITAAPK
jgi:glycosyltransferase involved in cell wall biosynthesis